MPILCQWQLDWQLPHEAVPILRAEPTEVTTGTVARVDSCCSASEVATGPPNLKIHYRSMHSTQPPVHIPCQGQLDWQLAHEPVPTFLAEPTGATTGKVARVDSGVSTSEAAAAITAICRDIPITE